MCFVIFRSPYFLQDSNKKGYKVKKELLNCLICHFFNISFKQESLRLEMESQRDEIIHQNNMEKEEMQNLFERAQEELNNQLIVLQRDRDDSLLLAENEKQQVLATFILVYS